MEGNSAAERSRNALQNQFAEDPRLEPLEKQTALHLEGDGSHFEISSSRKVVFAKLIQQPHFEAKWFNVVDDDNNRQTIADRDKVAADPSLTIIGVTGKLPVGAVTVGTPRQNNSHANIVK
jgi:hypothetical protein